jgi:hypothetical protein
MLKFLSASHNAVLVLFMSIGTIAHAQQTPSDFVLTATAGGVAPWSQAATFTLDSRGQATYTRYMIGGLTPVPADTTFTVSPVTVQQLWQAIQDSNFFGLDTSIADSTVDDGSFAEVAVTANGVSHSVLVKNASVPQIQSLFDSLNAAAPPLLQLLYQPPAQRTTLPRIRGAAPFGPVRTKDFAHALPGLRVPASPSGADVVLPHPGTVVAYDEPLTQAVADRTATLRSKGNYFGDDVSITVDNTVSRPSNTITITLYLEFWGPLATQTNVDKINADIKATWSGHTTTGGKAINLELMTRIDQGASVPPGTPGYHEISIVGKGAVRSNVSGSGGVNSGTKNGQWELDVTPGTYGHEAGHLMGLGDEYDDFHKQRDGSWVDPVNHTSYPNNDQFATYAASKFPGTLQTAWRSELQKMNVCSIPNDNSGNDLMADVSKPARQSSIDYITLDPGLLVRIPDGSVLSNRNSSRQSLVVTHAEDLFMYRGEKRTLNGLYGACIDHGKGIPDSTGLFDVIPPLGSWRGIAAAPFLSQFVHVMDSAGYYYGDNFFAQEGVWRITDNGLDGLGAGAEIILGVAGIHLGDQVLDFPHLTPGSTSDTTTLAYVPNELFVANIQPRFTDGSPGKRVTFSLGLSQPVNAGFTTGVSWTAKGPDTSAVTISGDGTGGSITPSRTGIYEVGLTMSVTDSALKKRTFASPAKAYVIVPDSLTETFEHANLTDRFPWRTFGDLPWGISGVNAQTGFSSAQPGPIGPNQASVLAIDLALPGDGAVTFSIRTACMEIVDNCLFSVDSLFVDQFTGISDWRAVTYPLRAGNHTLTWKCTGVGTTAGKVWLDNIFFPPHSIVTSASTAGEVVPAAFLLSQNYPNPFNPTTTIRYGLPFRSHVTLSVFNTLGQQVAQPVNGEVGPGVHDVTFNGLNLASGMYFYRIQAGGFVATKKFLLVR